ncbi:MAG TPA: aminoglycoside adenylyltransferase domain-containing protein [Symbiobacteriaceae bacterium]|jgi:hypothetical protein
MQPTPYPEVNEFVTMVWEQQHHVLGESLVGVYLGGSLALGDFAPNASDIDLLAVTAEPVSGSRLRQLEALHARVSASGHPWAARLEASYIPREAIRRHDPNDCHHPSIGETWAFGICHHDEAWVVQRWIIREQGVTVWGPPPATLIDPVTPPELRNAVATLLREDWRARLDNPEWFRQRNFQAYGILTMCRCQYTLAAGAIATKPAAASWAKAAMPQWAHLIDRALVWRHDTQPDDLAETLAFIREVVERND